MMLTRHEHKPTMNGRCTMCSARWKGEFQDNPEPWWVLESEALNAIDELRDALRPFAEMAAFYDHAKAPSPYEDDDNVMQNVGFGLNTAIKVGDFRRARAAMAGEGRDG